MTTKITVLAGADAGPAGHINPGLSLPCEVCDEFTRANVVGVFITLVLCQLTQPSGSLYFRGHGGFMWRLNPIVSFVEACIIFFHLGLAVWGVGVRRGRKVVLEELQRTASGLLLLRGVDVVRDDGNERLETLLRGTFLDQEDSSAPSGDDGSAAQGDVDSVPVSGIGATETQPSSTENANPGTPADEILGDNVSVSRQSTGIVEASSTATEGPTSGITDPAIRIDPAASFSIRRRTTASLEANSPSPPEPQDLTDFELPQMRRRRLLREAFGSNALAHREGRITAVTFFSVFVIFVKMFTVTGAAWFKTAVWFSLSGWIAVQTLLLLFHSRNMTEQDMAASIRLAKVLDQQLEARSNTWFSVFIAFHSPFFGFIAHRMTFGWPNESLVYFAKLDGVQGSNTSEPDISFVQSLTEILIQFKIMIGSLVLLAVPLFTVGSLLLSVVSLCRLILGKEPDKTTPITALLMAILSAVFGLAFGLIWCFGALGWKMSYFPSWGDSLALKVGWYFGYGVWNSFWLVVCTAILTGFFCGLAGAASSAPKTSSSAGQSISAVTDEDRIRVAATNVAFALAIFLWYVFTYDSRDTHKWWVGEYLG
ncbi:hypothetical protein B0H66DRAFT_558500 [Apodospora peruviana]|uniref:Uncharacterized protein n=1 Tax=Apodospora peruviana TaxID=516989 RepID=A0AAE0I5J0_9PEZI|nr:hypothetical protein B0H66DRAFT_558500 [Apodospora peruviana]